MSFLDRMKQPVETIGVGRYLFEKVAHVSSLTLLAILIFPGHSWWLSALYCGLGYTVIGKLKWLVQHRAFDLADALYDAVVVCFVAIVVFMFTRNVVFAGAALLVAIAYILIGSNNRWGSPS